MSDQDPQTPPPSHSIPDRGSGMVSRARLLELARRVGPSSELLHRHPSVVWLLIVVFVFGLAMTTFLLMVQSLIHAKAEVVIPDLTGKTLEQALDLISAGDLSLAKEAVEFNEAYPPGAIIKQTPAPGLKAREGKVIRVTLSSGGEVLFVPDVVNKPLPEAQNQLRAAGLLLGVLSEVHSERHEAGWVIEQDPPAAAVTNRGQMVDLKVSKGTPPEGTTLMPEFTNQPLSRAMDWVKERKLDARVREEIKPDLLPGVVMSQTPPPDTLVNGAIPIEFVVSRSTLTAADARTVRYEIPAGSDRVLVRIVVRDEKGEREIFQGYQDAGSLIEVPAVTRGASRARIFVNGVLIEERMLE